MKNMKRFFSSLKNKSLRSYSVRNLLISLFFIGVLVIGIGIFLFSVQNYVAEVYHSRGLSFLAQRNYDKAIQSMEKAIKINPKMDIYWRDLSQAYLFKLQDLIRTSQSLSAEKTRNEILFLASKSVNAAKTATDLNPKNVANWNVRGYIYQSMIGILGGSDDWAIKSYKKALEIEGNNPFIYTQLGRSYLGKADLAKQMKKEDKEKKDLEEAMKNFQEALKIKSDYAPALYQIAQVYIREGKTKEGIKKLEEAQAVAPLDVGLAFQLGVLYYSNGEIDKAQGEFEKAVKISPEYSNARYYLGLIYDQKGEKEKAIEQFKEIEKYNPDNKLVKNILQNLKSGKSALEGISNLPGVPIEEKPEEIEK